MARFVRQIGKRFLKRFNTSQEFIEKNEIGSDSPNILVTADADKLAQKSFNLTANNTAATDAGHQWQFTVYGVTSSQPLVIQDNSAPPSKIRIDRAKMLLGGTLDDPITGIPQMTLIMDAISTDLNNGVSSAAEVFRLPMMFPTVTTTEYGVMSTELDHPVEFEISDITQVKLNADYLPTQGSNFQLYDRFQSELGLRLDAEALDSFVVPPESWVDIQFSFLY